MQWGGGILLSRTNRLLKLETLSDLITLSNNILLYGDYKYENVVF